MVVRYCMSQRAGFDSRRLHYDRMTILHSKMVFFFSPLLASFLNQAYATFQGECMWYSFELSQSDTQGRNQTMSTKKCLFACIFALSASSFGCGDDGQEPVRACFGKPADLGIGGRASAVETGGSASIGDASVTAGAPAVAGTSAVAEVAKAIQCL